MTATYVRKTRKFAPLLLVWLLTIPAALPLLQPTLTQSADGLLHLYRVMALQQAIGQGALFPRWLPDLAFGYGFPLFVFYAPLSYYITVALSLLPGLSLLTAFNLSLALALFTAGTGAYLFVAHWAGPRAGLLGAAAYVYAPFHLYNTMFRGSLPAGWALALFPFVFWSFSLLQDGLPGLYRSSGDEKWMGDSNPLPLLTGRGWEGVQRLVTRLNPAGLAKAALILGLALLTHNTLSLLFVPLLALFLGTAVLVRFFYRGWSGTLLLKIVLALALGTGLAAFFLMPAILEKGFAQVQRVITSPDFDFRFHFVSAADLFSLLPPANTGLRNPAIPLTLGVAQLLLAALGLGRGLYLLWQPVRTSSTRIAVLTMVLFGAAALAGAVFMMLPASLPVWDILPLLAFVQFPHRLLGPSALALAGLAGLAALFVSKRTAAAITALGVLLIIAGSAPLLYPRYQPNLPAEPTVAGMVAYEQARGAIGTTSFGEYLPVWVKDIPRSAPPETAVQNSSPTIRLVRDTLPAQVQVELEQAGFNQVALRVDSPEAHRLIFHSFYFPGWQATLDGEPAPVEPFGERGLVSVGLPAGEHHLHLAFRETPLRQTANLISGIALLLIIGLLAWQQWGPGSSGPAGAAAAVSSKTVPSKFLHPGFSRHEFGLLAALGLGLIMVKVLYLDRVDNPFKHTFDGRSVAEAATPLRLNFGHETNLLGYTLAQPAVQPGETFRLTAYWQARAPLATDYSALAQLVDAAGNLYAGQDNLHPGSIPTSRWQPWEFVRDVHEVPVLPGTPPGDYFLAIGLYHPVTWARLPVIDGPTPAWPDVLAIPVAVAPPDRFASLAALDIAWPVEVDFGPALRLLGATPERAELRPNDFFRLALFWEARAAPGQNYRIGLRLRDEAGTVVIEQSQQPSHNRYPTGRWAAGERVRDNHALWIPADLPAGRYSVAVRVQDEGGRWPGAWQTLGEVTLVK